MELEGTFVPGKSFIGSNFEFHKLNSKYCGTYNKSKATLYLDEQTLIGHMHIDQDIIPVQGEMNENTLRLFKQDLIVSAVDYIAAVFTPMMDDLADRIAKRLQNKRQKTSTPTDKEMSLQEIKNALDRMPEKKQDVQNYIKLMEPNNAGKSLVFLNPVTLHGIVERFLR